MDVKGAAGKILGVVKKIPSWIGIFAIRFYQMVLSPHFPGCCRFYPTCSQYGLIAIKEYGLLKGVWLTAKRLSRCRPGGPYGYDPVP